MHARDANNATWFMLRYPEHFTVADPAAPPSPDTPRLDDTLFFDDARYVLELLPQSPDREAEPLSGLAVDANGETYRVDPATGRLLVGCGDHERPLVCEPQVLAGPRGLALDRRGLLYVADARARRVVVLLPEDGSVRAVLNGGKLEEPVDVATSPGGRIYVADRETGRIEVYSARHHRLGGFPVRNADGLPRRPRPIAVMVDADESVLVADGNHPRLLRFTPAGSPLADVELGGLTAKLAAGEVALDALGKTFGTKVPRFVAGGCLPPRSPRDGGEWLAEVHRALRLLRLRLGRRFAAKGVFVSAALDSGVPGTQWHRVEVDAALPAGASLTVETATSDALDGLDLTSDAVWRAPRDRDGNPIPVTASLADQLIQSVPGRYLWLRATLTSDGHATPSVRSIRLLYPRHSYLDLLPRVYRRDAEGAWFLERFLALFEWVFTRVENRRDEFIRELNPDAAPLEVLNWLACLVDLSFDPSWPLERRRELVNRAMELYYKRGTPQGIRLYTEIYTGREAEVTEAFLKRPVAPSYLGRAGSIVGCPLHLAGCAPDRTPTEQLYLEYAHRFTVLVYLDDQCDAEVLLPVVDRIIEVNKPAHTAHTLCPIYPEARVGLQSTLGLDLVVGGQSAAGTRLGGRRRVGEPEVAPSVLAVNSILGDRRPQYVRPRVPGL